MTEIDSMIRAELQYGYGNTRKRFSLMRWLGVKIRPTGKHRG